MASAPAPFSDEFAQTAREEVERLRVRAGEFEARGERWVARGQQLLQDAERFKNRIRDLEEILGHAPQLRLDLQSRALQGQRLRDEATRILLTRHGLKKPIHYRAWYELLTESGFEASGEKPLATFLSQITRSPIVERIDEQSGVYQLDPQGAYDRARAELAAARREVASVEELASHGATDAISGLSTVKQRLVRAQRTLDAVLQARSLLLHQRLGTA